MFLEYGLTDNYCIDNMFLEYGLTDNYCIDNMFLEYGLTDNYCIDNILVEGRVEEVVIYCIQRILQEQLFKNTSEYSCTRVRYVPYI